MTTKPDPSPPHGAGGADEPREQGFATERKWIAWTADDSSRESAQRYPDRHPFTPSDDVAAYVAEEHAEWEYTASAAECGNEFVVNVIAIFGDGVERAYSFNIHVDFEPTFTASERDAQCCEHECPDVVTHFARAGDIP